MDEEKASKQHEMEALAEELERAQVRRGEGGGEGLHAFDSLSLHDCERVAQCLLLCVFEVCGKLVHCTLVFHPSISTN